MKSADVDTIIKAIETRHKNEGLIKNLTSPSCKTEVYITIDFHLQGLQTFSVNVRKFNLVGLLKEENKDLTRIINDLKEEL